MTITNEFREKIEEHFAKGTKVETSTILAYLVSIKFKGKENIKEYINEMSYLTSKLKTLKG